VDKNSYSDHNKCVSAFWNENKWDKVPPYWCGFQPVQDYLAAKAGEPSHHYHKTLLRQHLTGKKFHNGISIACGLGRAERNFVKLGMVDGIIAGIDLSSVSIECARKEAEREGADSKLRYFASDIYDYLSIKNNSKSFDLAIGVGGLHHIDDPFRLMGMLRKRMTSNGILFVDEYVGPDYYQYDKPTLDIINSILSALHPLDSSMWPASWEGFSKKSFLDSDPSEGIASSHIMPAIEENFVIMECFNLCGNIIFTCIRLNACSHV
jgi:SAM-dependent methyltransferase